MFEDYIGDFDLDFLNHPNTLANNNYNESNKKKSAVLLTKKKIIATDSLVAKYYDQKNALEKTERNLYELRLECKQVCLDYKKATEKISKLEERERTLSKSRREWEERCLQAENRYNAISSHANQLQVLVDKNQMKEKLQMMENKAEKHRARGKEGNKDIQIWKKEKKLLYKHFSILKDIVLGKKKLTKSARALLIKYTLPSDEEEFKECEDLPWFECDAVEAQEVDYTTVLEQNYDNGDAESKEVKAEDDIILLPSTKSDNAVSAKYNDSDYSREITNSVDTGFGSSIATSDSEKCVKSPDSFSSESLIYGDHSTKTSDAQQYSTDIATSPIQVAVTCDAATSPIHFNTDPGDRINQPRLSEIRSKRKLMQGNPQSKNPNDESECDNYVGDPVRRERKQITTTVVTRNEKAIPEITVSQPDNEDHNDAEVELILNNMRINLDFITPLPSSPSCSVHSAVNDKCSCGEASRSREDNEIIKTTLALLTKEVMEMKMRMDALQTARTNNDKCQNIDAGVVTDLPSEVMQAEDPNVNCGHSCIDEDNDIIILNHPEKVSRNIVYSDDEEETPPPHVFDDVKRNNCDNNLSQGRKIPRNLRKRKLTKLEKLRMKLIQKPKIRLTSKPMKKSRRFRSLLKASVAAKRNKTESLNSKGLNESAAYEKALAVVAEFRAKKKKEMRMVFKKRTQNKRNTANAVENSPKENIESVDGCSKEVRVVVEKLSVTVNKEHTKSTNLVNLKATPESNTGSTEKTCNKQTIDSVNHSITLTSPRRITRNALKEIEKCQSKPETGKPGKAKIEDVPMKPERKLKRRSICEPDSRPKRLLRSNSSSIHDDTPLETFKENEVTASHAIANVQEAATPKNNSPRSMGKPYLRPKRSLRSNSASIHDDTPLEIFEKNDEVTASHSVPNVQEAPTPEKNSPRSISKQYLRPKRSLRSISSSIHDDTPLETFEKNDEVTASHAVANVQEAPTPEKNSPRSMSKQYLRPKRSLHSNSSSIYDDTPLEIFKEIDEVTATPAFANVQVAPSYENNNKKKQVNYSDLDIFENSNKDVEEDGTTLEETKKMSEGTKCSEKDSVLCKMIEKYALTKNRQSFRKISDTMDNIVCKKIEESINGICELPPNETASGMDKVVEELKQLKHKDFLSGLIWYFRQPDRRSEQFSKKTMFPAPPMSKNEQILLYFVIKLKDFWTGVYFVDEILQTIEYALFRLNNTPELYAIEGMSHFYAVLCRYTRAKSRLRMFMIDAMYCLSYKAIPLIRQCLEVWSHVLPLAHMSAARSPLVVCVVYVLHFFKCKDYLNKVSELRTMLSSKYSYQITEWTENDVIEMFKNAIMEVRDIPIEKKMLRIALIILSKRQGPKWCDRNIIKGVLFPIIENPDVREHIRYFCVSLLGPLLRPFPIEMKVHCEIVLNQLFDMLDQGVSPNMEEAIITSLVYMVKHDVNRVNRALLSWQSHTISPDLERLLKDYVREKSLKAWKNVLKRAMYQCDS